MLSYQHLIDECSRLAEIAKGYSGKCQAVYKELSESVVRTEYARGGEAIHRGYYCPSPVLDMIVGNASRGKLLKDISKVKKKPDYQFGFADENKLVIVQHSSGREFLIRNGEGVELGITFSKYGIEAIAECRYDGDRIQSYLYGLYFEGGVTEYRKETYEYGAEGLAFVDLYTFNHFIKPIYAHERFQFEHKDGFLSKYRTVPCDDPLLKDRSSIVDLPFSVDDMEYDVYIKRKI